MFNKWPFIQRGCIRLHDFGPKKIHGKKCLKIKRLSFFEGDFWEKKNEV